MVGGVNSYLPDRQSEVHGADRIKGKPCRRAHLANLQTVNSEFAERRHRCFVSVLVQAILDEIL
jgi:hypothetical protein